MEINIENKKDLQLFATYYVEASDISTADKNILINFIKEASEPQIEYLLMKGRMESNPVALNEVDTFLSTFLGAMKGLYDASGGGISGAATVAVGSLPVVVPAALVISAATFAATKIYKNYLSKAAKACSGKKGFEKKSCMHKFKVDALKQRIANMSKGATQCAKSKNPAKCKAGILKKINKLKTKIEKV